MRKSKQRDIDDDDMEWIGTILGAEPASADVAETPAKGGQKPFQPEIRGNFNMGDWFGAVTCIHGHKVRLFNIGRGHWWACDECRSCVNVGRSLMSTWKFENQRVWDRNARSIQGYTVYE